MSHIPAKQLTEGECVCSYPFHGVLVIGKVVEAQRHSGRSHRRPGDFQQLLNSSLSHELCSKLLVQQQRGQVLRERNKQIRLKSLTLCFGNMEGL